MGNEYILIQSVLQRDSLKYGDFSKFSNFESYFVIWSFIWGYRHIHYPLFPIIYMVTQCQVLYMKIGLLCYHILKN